MKNLPRLLILTLSISTLSFAEDSARFGVPYSVLERHNKVMDLVNSLDPSLGHLIRHPEPTIREIKTLKASELKTETFAAGSVKINISITRSNRSRPNVIQSGNDESRTVALFTAQDEKVIAYNVLPTERSAFATWRKWDAMLTEARDGNVQLVRMPIAGNPHEDFFYLDLEGATPAEESEDCFYRTLVKRLHLQQKFDTETFGDSFLLQKANGSHDVISKQTAPLSNIHDQVLPNNWIVGPYYPASKALADVYEVDNFTGNDLVAGNVDLSVPKLLELLGGKLERPLFKNLGKFGVSRQQSNPLEIKTPGANIQVILDKTCFTDADGLINGAYNYYQK
jgi:hypothetical protein